MHLRLCLHLVFLSIFDNKNQYTTWSYVNHSYGNRGYSNHGYSIYSYGNHGCGNHGYRLTDNSPEVIGLYFLRNVAYGNHSYQQDR